MTIFVDSLAIFLKLAEFDEGKMKNIGLDEVFLKFSALL
jgi:hypothetical protein